MKTKAYIFLVISVIILFYFPTISLAVEGSTTLEAPIMNIPIPTLEPLTNIEVVPGQSASIPWIAQYIVAIYRYGLIIAAIFAVIAFMISGIMYLTAGGLPQNIQKAKSISFGATLGVILLVFSYLILNMINPNLTELKSLTIETLKEDYIGLPEDHADTDPVLTQLQPGQKPQALTNDKNELMKLCNTPKTDWPKTTPGISDPNNTVKGFSAPGIKSASKILPIDKGLITPLTKMGEAALAYPGGPYEILIKDGYRSLNSQIIIACNHKADNFKDVGTAYAWPGGSLHGIGRAVDIKLEKNGTPMTTFSFADQFGSEWVTGAKILADIAYSTGWKRYTNEIWHFEYQSGITSCRTTTCTKAAKDCNCN
jgi:LAS superfamily LD-carboxypeptidase LdcB